jgi:hypothetical protein
VSLVAIILYVAFQQVFIVVSVYCFIDLVRKLLDRPWYVEYEQKYEVIITTIAMHSN